MKLNLKERLKELMNMSKQMLSLAVEYILTLVCIGALSLLVMKSPEFHDKYLRSHVGSKVYMIRDSYDSGGGTGFAVKAASGETYILTNDHVCGVSSDGDSVLVTGEEGSMRRHIIAHDEDSDLCLIQAPPDVEGLSVAQVEPALGDHVSVVGHPRLMPLHVSNGEMTGKETISILMGYIAVQNPDTHEDEQIPPQEGGMLAEQCVAAKYSQQYVNIDMLFLVLKVKVCIMTVHDAYVTSVTIHPGNSGSPMVNFWGNVVGVAFASDNSTNWGRIVPLSDIKSFLKDF